MPRARQNRARAWASLLGRVAARAIPYGGRGLIVAIKPKDYKQQETREGLDDEEEQTMSNRRITMMARGLTHDVSASDIHIRDRDTDVHGSGIIVRIVDDDYLVTAHYAGGPQPSPVESRHHRNETTS